MSFISKTSSLIPNVLTLAAFMAAIPCHAATIVWTDWTSVSPGNPGSGSGSIAVSPTLAVTYAGQTSALLTGYPSWTPTTTFSGGSVSNAPPAANNSIQLEGGSSLVETLTFSSPVLNPVMAIWSLGAPGNQASFVFTGSEPFTLEAGGPSAEYGGSSISVSGNSVLGAEGNGVIQFNGTFSTLTWTNPVFENYYAFTVGVTGLAAPVPEPSGIALLAAGFGVLFLFRRLARSAKV